MFAMAIWDPTTKFNSRQYFWLYGNIFLSWYLKWNFHFLSLQVHFWNLKLHAIFIRWYMVKHYHASNGCAWVAMHWDCSWVAMHWDCSPASIGRIYHKATLVYREIIMWISQNGPLKKFTFMRSSVSCIIMYGVIKNLCSTNLCDRRLTLIIRINKTHAEECRFTVDWLWNVFTQHWQGFPGCDEEAPYEGSASLPWSHQDPP